jgi:hypothetical protein
MRIGILIDGNTRRSVGNEDIAHPAGYAALFDRSLYPGGNIQKFNPLTRLNVNLFHRAPRFRSYSPSP